MSKLLRVFLAGPSRDLTRCETVMWSIREFAIISFDWVAPMRANLDAGIADSQIGDNEARLAASLDEKGVDDADVVLWLATGSPGAAWEASRANAQGKPVLVVGAESSIYGRRLPDDCKFASDADAIAALADIAIRRMSHG